MKTSNMFLGWSHIARRLINAFMAFIVAFFLPIIFSAFIVFAFTQSFSVSMIILVALCVLEIMLTEKFPNLEWNQYADFEPDYWQDSVHVKPFFFLLGNILFNITRVVLLLAFMVLVRRHFPEPHQFSSEGYAIIGAASVISILALIFWGQVYSYARVKALVALLIAMCIFFFTYSYFGTQLVWVAVFLTLFFGVAVNGFKELGEAIGLWKQHFAYSLSAVLIVVSTISTIVQFWQTIIEALCYRPILGLDVYWLLLMLAALVASSLFVRRGHLRKKEKIRLRRLAEEKATEQKEAKARQKEAEEAADKRLNDIKLKINDIFLKENLSVEDLYFLARNASHISNEGISDAQLLAKIDLRQYFTICHSKRQIIFHHSIKEVLIWLNGVYIKSYKDADLKIIKETISSLSDYLTQYQNFAGYQAFCDLLDVSLDPALRSSF